MQLTEMFEESLATGEDFVISTGNDKELKVRMPKVRDIIKFGEPKYYKIVYAFAATSSDYKFQLDDMGFDWQEVSDYDMFILLFKSMRHEDLSILFGDVDMSKFELVIDNETGEKLFINEENGLIINKIIYECISGYICAMHCIDKNYERASDERTRLALIEESRDNYNINKNKPARLQLRRMVCAMANTPEFKGDYFSAMDYPISIFMDCVRQVQKIKHYNYTMQGIYAGTIDSKRVSKAAFDWIGQSEKSAG
nr:MAG TPA: hypothetical protein [Caudoviricetes sp.]